MDILTNLQEYGVIGAAFTIVLIMYKILYLIFDYPHKHYTFKYFEV